MTDTKALVEKYGIRANKSLGQNFLHRSDIINSIATAASGGAHALEIGAGLGVLTHALCDRFETVTTVEIDRSLEKVTRDVLSDVSNHTMVYRDFLKYDFCGLPEKVTAVGNLPYNITGEIIMRLIKNVSRFDKAVVMLQKEAAEKLAACPRDKNYRAISVLTQFYCDITVLCDVSPDSFIPAPNVWSRVIILNFKDRRYDARFNEFVHRVFNQRRKLLTSVLQNADEKACAVKILETLGFGDKTRGEELSPDALYQLYRGIYCEQK